jgi:hypothetical protein
MMPPIVPRTLLAAATAPLDHDSVIGDLHEEYLERFQSLGRAHADRWYWSQTLRSIPSLLSYSRAPGSLGAGAATVAIAALVLFAMLALNELIADAILTVYHSQSGTAAWPFFLAGWLDAACCGAVLAALLRSRGVRAVLLASLALIAAIAIPARLLLTTDRSHVAAALGRGARHDAGRCDLRGAPAALTRTRTVPPPLAFC